MASAFRFALYAWLLVSAVALIIQLVRRRRFNQAEANQTLTPPIDQTDSEGESDPPSSLANLLDGLNYPVSLRPLVPEGAAQIPDHQCLVTSDSTPEEVGQALTLEFEKQGYEIVSLTESEALAKRSDGELTLSIVANPNDSSVAGVRRFPSARPGDVVVEIWKGSEANPALA